MKVVENTVNGNHITTKISILTDKYMPIKCLTLDTNDLMLLFWKQLNGNINHEVPTKPLTIIATVFPTPQRETMRLLKLMTRRLMAKLEAYGANSKLKYWIDAFLSNE